MGSTPPTPTRTSAYDEAYYTTGNYADYLGRGPRYRELAAQLVGWLNAAGRPIVPWLDFGCGPGLFLGGLAGRGVPAIGYDTSTWAVTRAARVGLPAHADPAVLTDQRWAVMTALDVFEHMEAAEVDAALLAAGPESLVVRIPVAAAPGRPYVLAVSRRDPTHRPARTKDQWRGQFRRLGYVEVARLALPAIYDAEGVYCAHFVREEADRLCPLGAPADL